MNLMPIVYLDIKMQKEAKTVVMVTNGKELYRIQHCIEHEYG